MKIVVLKISGESGFFGLGHPMAPLGAAPSGALNYAVQGCPADVSPTEIARLANMAGGPMNACKYRIAYTDLLRPVGSFLYAF